MTREEAIEVIKQDIPCEHDTDLIEALEMAIQALEQEQIVEQEPCEYVISRQDMLDAIGHGTTYTSEELQKIINGLPDVKAERRENDN